jgi:hypothetical protein
MAASSSEDRAACFGSEARKKLTKALATVDAELEARGLFEAAQKSVPYSIRTKETCFDFADADAVKQHNAVWSQMVHAVDFLAELHRARRGRAVHWFTDVLVCNAKDLDDNSLVQGGLWGGELRLEDTTLQIGIKRSVTGGFDIQKATKLRDRWDRGEHLAKTALDDRGHVFVEKVWPVINRWA